MFEVIGRIIAWLFAEILVEWLFGGILKLIHSVGVRIYSLFVGTGNLPVAKLRLMYKHLALPWLIGFSVFGVVLYFGVAWLINHT